MKTKRIPLKNIKGTMTVSENASQETIDALNRLSESLPNGFAVCPECEGKKVRAYSCCTGEHVGNDILMCPTCKEHLGEEPCYTCKGKGWVIEEF